MSKSRRSSSRARCSFRSMNPDKGVLVRGMSILSGHKAIRNVYHRKTGDKMCVQEPIMISSRNLKTTTDAKQGVIQQMGIKYVHNLGGESEGEEDKKIEYLHAHMETRAMAPASLHRTTFSSGPAHSAQVNHRLRDCSSRWYCGS